MPKIEVKDYISELRAEHQKGFQDGYATAWKEINRIVRQAAIEASIQASTKRED